MLCHWCSTLLFFGVRRYEEYLSTPNFWGLFFKKSSVPCFITNIICIFAVAFCLIWLWCPLSRTELQGGALHIRRRYWRFVFVLRNYHTRILDKNIADVTPRGVYIRLRSVLRGLMPLAHFTDIYIPCVGVYSVCFPQGCGWPDCWTGKCRHHVFYL